MAAIADPGGMAPGEGCGPGRRLASGSPQSALPTSGAVVISCAPAGLTGAGAIETDGGGVGVRATPGEQQGDSDQHAPRRAFS